MEPSWAEAVQSLTEKLSLDNLPLQVRRCRGEDKADKEEDKEEIPSLSLNRSFIVVQPEILVQVRRPNRSLLGIHF